MHPGDIPAGLHLCRLSGWNQLEDDWRAFLDSPEGGARLAESDGVAVGTVTFLRYGRRWSWLSMMLVHPDARGAGVGTQLMNAALEALAGEMCIRLDATPLGQPLYRRFGFRAEYELARATAIVRSGCFGPVPEHVRPMAAGDLNEVFARDRGVFGADRSRVLSSFYCRAPELAWTLRRGDAILGYCFGRPGYLYRQIGPVVAEDAGAARDLVSGCLASQPGQKVALDLPRHASDLMACLESAGFAVERLFLRMWRGPGQGPRPSASEFAIAGPEFG